MAAKQAHRYPMALSSRIEWLSLMRGLCILLVVIGHVQLVNQTTGNTFQFCEIISSPFTPIRMPLFVFSSGGLLFLSRIDKEWSVSRLYLDKMKRILCPFLFFVAFFYVLKIAMNPLVKTSVDCSLSDFLLSFAIYSGHPSEHLWFLAVLLWFMLMYPLFRWLCQGTNRMVAFLIFALSIHFFDIDCPPERNYFYIFTLNYYLVYFFFGIFFFKYRLFELLDNSVSTLFFVVCYAVTYALDWWFLATMTGILSMVGLCQLLSSVCPKLFSSFREYIYQIYLLSLIFQGFVELLLWQKLFYHPPLVYLFYLVNLSFGIYGPVLVSKAVERTPWTWLHLLFGLRPLTTSVKAA